jgi:hypothetical protein
MRGKHVIYSADENVHKNKLSLKQGFISPFSAFVKTPVQPIKSVTHENTAKSLEFLKSNGLLSSSSKKTTQLSGDTLNSTHSKDFAHDLADASNMNGTISMLIGTNSCINPTVSSFVYGGPVTGIITTCGIRGSNSVSGAFNINESGLTACQVLHNQCMDDGTGAAGVGHTHAAQLPVELQEFKID